MRDTHAKKGHKAVLVLLGLFLAWALIPVFGVGMYRNGSGQIFFDLWYLIGFMVVAFFLMHELITPLPPKDETATGKKSGREGSGRMLTPMESSGK
ncbi:MAG TPA: hypothetical protein VMN04_15435 [Thermoanaerobaculia bacterium]|nr:hypothetical protein [Thermoanaerobaculia bacterium]